MDARSKTVKQILHSTEQYLIPFFQRSYSWEKKQWKRLTEDIVDLLAEPTRTQHFLGPLVCTPGNHVPGEVHSYQLIDGQQRLTTLSILLTAFRDVADDRGLKDLVEQAEEDYLVHKRRPGLQRYKIIPRIGDREIFTRLIDRKERLKGAQSSVGDAYDYFRPWIEKRVAENPTALQQLLTTIVDRLSLVVITITGENPYEIFESLNSTGLPLEESDLIRNHIFMQVLLNDQDEFNREHWEPFESILRSKVGDRRLEPTKFYRNYLMQSGRYSKKKCTFIEFKIQTSKISPPSLAVELLRHLRYARLIEQFDRSDSTGVNAALGQLIDLEVATTTPLVMNLLDQCKAGGISEADLLGCLADLSSFVLRRSVCGASARSYDEWFVKAIGEIKADPRRDLQNYYFGRGWPSDPEFIAALVRFGLYHREPRKGRLILDRLEHSYGHKEPVDKSALTVEHILPQKPNEAAVTEWKSILGGGDNWYSVHQEWVHTIGNLTLTGYNRELSNRSFVEKRPELLRSKLDLNRYFENVGQWGPQEIEVRGQKLAVEVAKLWPNPVQPTDGERVKVPGPTGPNFDVTALRRAALSKLALHFGKRLKAEGAARFTADDGAFRLVCLGSRPRPDGDRINYWFGFSPAQLEFLRPTGYLSLCCGSPDRVLLFSAAEFSPLTASMHITPGGSSRHATTDPDESPPVHWHVSVFWGTAVHLDLPKKGERLDVTNRVFVLGN